MRSIRGVTCCVMEVETKPTFFFPFLTNWSTAILEALSLSSNKVGEVEVINTFKVNFNNQLEKLYHKKFEDIDEDEERLMALEAKGDELTDLKKLRVWF